MLLARQSLKLGRFKIISCKQSTINMDVRDLSQIRKPYNNLNNALLEENLASKNPFKLFDNWIKVACDDPNIREPNAMTLCTANKAGQPSARMVLLKGYGTDGFRFFTNYRSDKAQQIAANPQAALVLYWADLNRSIRVEGCVKKLPEQPAIDYFNKRPRISQIGALASTHQSKAIENREALTARVSALESELKDTNVVKPDFWGGYIVEPAMIEFWQGQNSRVHDRIRFRRKEELKDEDFVNEGEEGWAYQRLEP